jgi:hypothetical protein
VKTRLLAVLVLCSAALPARATVGGNVVLECDAGAGGNRVLVVFNGNEATLMTVIELASGKFANFRAIGNDPEAPDTSFVLASAQPPIRPQALWWVSGDLLRVQAPIDTHGSIRWGNGQRMSCRKRG